MIYFAYGRCVSGIQGGRSRDGFSLLRDAWSPRCSFESCRLGSVEGLFAHVVAGGWRVLSAVPQFLLRFPVPWGLSLWGARFGFFTEWWWLPRMSAEWVKERVWEEEGGQVARLGRRKWVRNTAVAIFRKCSLLHQEFVSLPAFRHGFAHLQVWVCLMMTFWFSTEALLLSVSYPVASQSEERVFRLIAFRFNYTI